MKTFAYKARKNAAEIVTGEIQAEDRDRAARELASQGLFPLEITLQKSQLLLPFTGNTGASLSVKEKIFFLENLADLLEAGLPILRALEVLSAQPSRPHARSIFADIKESVRTGKSLSAGMQKHPKDFPVFIISMLQAGEQSGTLDLSLLEIVRSLERENDLRSKVSMALIYPGIILGFGILTILVLLLYVIPQLQDVYTDFGGELPWITRQIIAGSAFLAHYGWLFLGIAAIAGFSVYRRAKSDKNGILWLYRLPWAGRFLMLHDLIYFTRSLGTLLHHGIPIIEALSAAADIVRNPELNTKIIRIKGRVIQGEPISESLKNDPLFSGLFYSFVQTGEETGNLDKALLKISKIYEREVDTRVKITASLIEPLLILGMGCVVAVLVVSMLLPIFEINLLVS